MKVKQLKKILGNYADTDEVEVIIRNFTEHPNTTVALKIKEAEIKLNKKPENP